jgi:hypothetical protein
MTAAARLETQVESQDEIEAEWSAHQRRVEMLAAKLDRAQTTNRETKLALKAERVVGDQLAKKRQRFGLLAWMQAGSD